MQTADKALSPEPATEVGCSRTHHWYRTEHEVQLHLETR